MDPNISTLPALRNLCNFSESHLCRC